MMYKRFWLRAAALPALFLALASCDEASPVAPATTGARFDLLDGVTLLQCAVPTAQSTSFVAGLLGGSGSVGGNSLLIPLNALLSSTSFTLSVPADSLVGVKVTAGGSEHFDFLLPVTLTISYARCPSSATLGQSLRVYYIDRDTREVLEDMGGIDNPLTKTVTILTDHFSDYVIGINYQGSGGNEP